MYLVKRKTHVVYGVILVNAFVLIVVYFDVKIFLSEEFAEEAMGRALINGFILALPLSVFALWTMLRNYQYAMELSDIVARDRLTDVATRDFFFEKLEADDGAYGVSLMVDIDHFKSINDTYGHLSGDTIIKSVAEIIKESTRQQDIVCRFGGEEFVVYLHEATIEKGFEIAERMRLTVADKVHQLGESDVSVTISIGGSLKERIEDISVAIKEADEALYRAKSQGRNQTVFATQLTQAEVDCIPK